MRQCPIGAETFGISDMYGICAIFSQLFFDAVEFVTDSESFEVTPEGIGQHTAFGQQLQRHIGHLAVFNFTIYEYVVHLLFCFYG